MPALNVTVRFVRNLVRFNYLNLLMVDVHTASVRSYNMSRIKSKNTKPETIVRKKLHAAGYRFRLHVKDLPGKPDIVLAKYETVVFVHGCFWHGHAGCKYFVVPGTNTEWWLQKINRNKELDSSHAKKLKKLGWKVLNVYECELKKNKLEETIQKLTGRLKKNS
jgi:DNA mismatch endonuclease, patch repair protein